MLHGSVHYVAITVSDLPAATELVGPLLRFRGADRTKRERVLVTPAEQPTQGRRAR